MFKEMPISGKETEVTPNAQKQSAASGKLARERLKAEREECVKSIVQAMNVSTKEADKMLSDAMARLDISPKLYCKYAFYNVPEAMQETMLEKVKAAEERRLEKARALRERRERYEAEIADNTGWGIDKVKEEIQSAKDRLGVTIDEYFENQYYFMTAEQQEECHSLMREEKKKQKKLEESKQADARAKVLASISQQTGRTKAAHNKELTNVQNIVDISPELYLAYRVFEMNTEEQPTWAAEAVRIEKQKNARLQRSRQALIDRAAMYMGVSVDEAERQLSDITKVYKLTFAEAVKCHFYSLPESEKKATANAILKERAETTRGYGKKHTQDLAEDLKCSEKTAIAIHTEAKNRLGVSSYLYNLYRFQDVPVSEQAEWYRKVLIEEEEKKESADQARTGRIERVAVRSGWSYVEAEQAMVDAWNRSEISFSEYLQNDFYLLSPEEQDEIHKELVLEREKLQALERETCIEAIMEDKGCSAEEAEEMLADAERRLKITPQIYRRYLFFKVPVSEQRRRYQEVKEQLSDRTQIQIDDYESYLAKIIEASGWTKEETLKRVRRAKENCGASWKDFYAFKFWNLTDEEQKEYFTTEVSQAVTKKYYDLRSRDIFVNKEVYLEKFKDTLGRNWVVSNRVTEAEFAEAFKNDKKVMYKPSNNGNSGGGIEIFDLTNGYKEAYEQIAKLPRGIVEGYLIQHEELNRLYPYSVNTIRVATICHDGEVEIPYAILRIGANKSCVDNFTTGGMVADVDLETGRARTDAVNVHGELFELVRRAGRNVNGYIGWDLAISVNGPTLIEGNVDPGNRLLQMPHIPAKKGMAHIMRKYL